MIAQSHKASCFKSLARYLERPKSQRPDLRRVAWAEPRNLVCTGSLQQMAWEMAVVSRGSERVQKPVYHVSVSWAPEDEPTRWHMATVADEVMHTLSLSDHQAVYVAHADEAYKHVHVMANLVHPDTRRVQKLGWHYGRIEAVLRHAERRYGFREVPGHYFQLPEQKAPDRSQSLSKGAHKALCRDQDLPFQVIVRRVAELDFAEATSWKDLTDRLDHHGLRLEARRSGLIVTDGREYAKSSSVAPGVSRRLLEERFGEAFEPDQLRGLTKHMESSRLLEAPVPALESYGFQWTTPGQDELGL